MSETTRVGEAAAYLRQRLGQDRLSAVTAGIVLGSGLKSFGATLTDVETVEFSEVTHWPAPKVEGHGGQLLLGRAGRAEVLCLNGRVHLYEGWHPVEVVRAVRTLRVLGVGTFLLTNAAGGIADALSPGDLMVLTDHINLTGTSPLLGAPEPDLGPRFPDQSAVYDAELRELLTGLDPTLHAGVYAGLLGPSYETPAEVRMLRTLGADAVGMSTVHEAMALNAMGARVAGISLISNLAAGIADTRLSHQEVLAAGVQAEARMTSLVTGFLTGIAP